MPAKGTIGKYHGRFSFISKGLWKKYVKETGDDIEYQSFLQIIAEEMKELRKWVLREPIGFQIPQMGNIAVNKIHPSMLRKRKFETFIYNGGKTKIKNFNVHTGGYFFKLQWFRATNKHSSRLAYYYFAAYRDFKRELGGILNTGEYPNYNCYAQDHFIKGKE